MASKKSRSKQLTLAGLSAAAAGALMMTALPTAANAAAAPAEGDMWTPTVAEDGTLSPVLDAKDRRVVDVWIETEVDTDRDGVKDRLHAKIGIPSVAGPDSRVPTVIQASPYFAGLAYAPQHNPFRELWDPSQPKTETEIGTWTRPGEKEDNSAPGGSISERNLNSYWLQRGYATMALAAVGTEQSTGCPTMLDHDEANATKAAIQWLAGDPNVKGYTSVDGEEEVSATEWSAGKAAMTGTSYDGALPMLTSTTGVEGLSVIAPMAPVNNFYDYYHFGGGMYGPQGYQGEDLDNYVIALRGNIPEDKCYFLAEEFAAQQDRDSGDYNDFWDSRNMMNDIDNVTTPTLIGHGQADLNVRVNQSTDWYTALKERGVPTKLYLHQRAHTSLDRVTNANWTTERDQWFAHYMYGIDNGADVIETSSRIQLEDGQTWIDEPAWPAAGTEGVTLYPTAGGDGVGGLEAGSRTGLFEVATFEDDSTVPLYGLLRQDESDNRLLYQSEPLAEEVRLSGEATAQLQVAIDAPAANITMAIVDIDPDAEDAEDLEPGKEGADHIIARAWTDPQNRTDVRTTEAVVPGESYALNLTFVPTDYRIPAGHRIGLMIAQSDTETSLLPELKRKLTVDTSATSITLPVTGATEALEGALGDFVAPALEVTAASVDAPGEVTIVGSGLAPETELQLAVGDAEPVNVTTNAHGTFSRTVDIDEEGEVAVRGFAKLAVQTHEVVLTAGRATIASTSFDVSIADDDATPGDDDDDPTTPDDGDDDTTAPGDDDDTAAPGDDDDSTSPDDDDDIVAPGDDDSTASGDDDDTAAPGDDSTSPADGDDTTAPAGDRDDETPTGGASALPQTGAEVSPVWAGGLGLLLGGLVLLTVRRRRSA